MKSRTYIRVAILFLATLVIIFWGLNYMKGKNLLSPDRNFFAKYDRIGGLTKSSPVTINGFQIGQVRGIKLSEQDPGLIEVKFSITYPSIKIPEGSIARIYSVDLMGTKGIALDLTGSQSLCSSGDTLGGSIEGDLRDQVNAQMLPIKMKVESLMSSMDSVLTGIQMVFNQNNRTNLAESFYSVNQTLNNLESASKFLDEYIRTEFRKITSLVNNIDTLSQGLLVRTEELKGFISNMNRFSDTLAKVPLNQTITAFREVLGGLDQMIDKINTGDGTLGKLIVNDSLYTAVLATNAGLNRLIEDIRLHPGKYVRVTLSDKSRSVYAADDSELARVLGSEGSSDYYLCLLQSQVPLVPGDPALKGVPATNFIQVGSLFYYYTYSSQRIEPCIKRLEKVRKQEPGAGIFTWAGGKWTRLSI